MKFNTHPEFAGIETLKKKHQQQLESFELWASENQWKKFHSEHYDWWVFPVNRRSSYGYTWTVYEGDIFALQQDELFITRYRRGVELVSLSWGWDVFNATHISNPKDGQCWHNWSVRLYKAAQSTKLFGFDELFASLKKYALELMEKGEPMRYNGKDLSWIFTTGKEP